MSEPAAPGAGLPSDKLYAPMNAPRAAPISPGTQPGVSGGIVLGQYVIIFGTTGGMFVYAGTPALGNPPVYSISNADLDPYGNTVNPGVWAGQYGGNQAGLQVPPGANFGQLIFKPPGAYLADPAVYAVQQNGGATLVVQGARDSTAGDQVAMNLYDNLAAAGSAAWQLVYIDASGGFHQFAIANFGGLNLGPVSAFTATQPGTGTSLANVAAAEIWHQVTPLSNSWLASGGGVNGLFYRLVLPDLVEVIADVINATATGNSVCATLPAGYRPSTNQNHPAGWNDPAPSNSASVPWVNVSTGGALQVTGLEVANKGVFFHLFIPLGTI